MSLVGTWHIYKMDSWNKDYFNMEVQAYIKICNDYNGDFQFGLVTGYLNGEIEGKKRISFSFDGEDENDLCSGRGYIELETEDSIKGKFYIHQGEKSGFVAKRA